MRWRRSQNEENKVVLELVKPKPGERWFSPGPYSNRARIAMRLTPRSERSAPGKDDRYEGNSLRLEAHVLRWLQGDDGRLEVSTA